MKKNIIYILFTLLFGYLCVSAITNTFAKNIDNMNFTITGHRGAAGLAPENTLLAMQRGLEAGADYLECDIHLTRDGEVVVCHDTTINRTTTGKGKIEDMTLQEILSYNIVDKYGNETEFKIPTLDELLGFVAGRTKVLIEIKRRKNQYPGLEEAMIELIKKHNAQEWVTVQSFNDSALENTHSLMPEIALEKLFVFRLCGLPYIFDGTFAGFSADKYKHIDSFNIYYRSASKRLVESIHKMGKKVKLWSIKDNNTKIPDVGADGIITDRPDQW